MGAGKFLKYNWLTLATKRDCEDLHKVSRKALDPDLDFQVCWYNDLVF